MLKIINRGNAEPFSWVCDPTVEFQPGQIAELTVLGNQICATVSAGLAPIGIIDDIRTKSFTNVSWNEEIIVPIQNPSGSPSNPTVPYDTKVELKHPSIVKTSFRSSVPVELNANNGVITFIAGTPLNFNLTGNGPNDSIRAIVNYTYYIPNIPGDDSTASSGRMTVWYNRGIFETTVYETNQQYAVRANLFVSEMGLLTTRQPSTLHPAVATVTAPPSAISPTLQFMWF